MADLNITSHDGLIEATIKAKQETYYLVTDDNLNSLKHKSLLSDLFVLLASLSWGAYFSVIITIKSNLANFDPTKPSNEILQPLETLEIVFLIAGILFTLLAGWTFFTSFKQIKKMKEGKLEVKDNNQTESDEE